MDRQRVLAARRAGRLEAALLGRHLTDIWPGDAGDAQTALGHGLIRDGTRPRALQTLVRYPGSVLADLFRALAALEARQTQAQGAPGAAPATLELTSAKPNESEKDGQHKDLTPGQSANRCIKAVVRSCPFDDRTNQRRLGRRLMELVPRASGPCAAIGGWAGC